MGLAAIEHSGKYPVYDLGDKSVIDIGGGPVSMLLKAVNAGDLQVIIDPCAYPGWTQLRYADAGIIRFENPAEKFFPQLEGKFDEAWIYNVLQHVEDPAKIIENAKRYAKTVRLFEWIDMPAHEGHPHELTEASLSEWLGVPGTVEELSESGCYGRAFYAIA
jgi:hypothetical protein